MLTFDLSPMDVFLVQRFYFDWDLCKNENHYFSDLSLSGWPMALGIWPLTMKHGATDISGFANNGVMNDVTYADGPNGI